ncbi:MAG: 16S rRNA (guanine(966)-N(2))-methyltransferase RsmD [Paraglaciecola sp.]|uniref:16S rRNA (guanine(966)-N(2))-methyltransferase RsmD n=1 Tax=Paraglaciecola sp. TaxID=1920173 RepID=UPI00273F0AB8|nr:16S rRNA (guanine(966)-N(2))-methyltransferase RsmD [Paraglaciecola sp.]MDP5030083.1 16S rRNA (guanine(966)-N(2))-methyltransferase RsmD [Paraglaciecola sp.]MDP5039462.1 16S rRNA (guanine(966)-N(2))-methyltransferase RsmD [Paraglaciecola sp.]MDP5130504.1 16S rRNA (guanine(966)-N(2))-methyltransferase RsmD [Paraglaciecola sp.]
MKRGVKPSKQPSGSIRIISGRWRGSKLPVANVQGLRPTTDRNKETLFNWLMPYVQNARCLDVFAGSGGLGFEALSRYAKHVDFIELDKAAVTNIQQNLVKLKAENELAKVITGNALQVLPGLKQQFDIIFLDPPFHQNLLPETLRLIHEHQVLAPSGIIYIECEQQAADYVVPVHWQLLKERQGGQLCARLYQN